MNRLASFIVKNKNGAFLWLTVIYSGTKSKPLSRIIIKL